METISENFLVQSLISLLNTSKRAMQIAGKRSSFKPEIRKTDASSTDLNKKKLMKYPRAIRHKKMLIVKLTKNNSQVRVKFRLW